MSTKSERIKRLRVDGYIRVSQVGYRAGESFISPSVQREQVLAWAQARGAQVLEIWEELDESGGRRDRPLLETAVSRIEAGVSDGLVVAKVDRFGRSLLDGLLMIQRIEAAGGTFFSVTDGLDLNTDTGRLVLHIMLSMAEWELHRYRQSSAISAQKRIARGAFVGGFVPPGYRKTRAGRLKPDPRTAPAITELFLRRADGSSLKELARFLEGQGVRTGRGSAGWRASTVTSLLRNDVYLGTVHAGRHRTENAHRALVEPATWAAAQRPRIVEPRNTAVVLLAGLIRCAGCGFVMGAGRKRTSPHDFLYLCSQDHAGGRCQQPTSISARLIHPCVEEIAFLLLTRRGKRPARQLAVAEENVAHLQADLARYRDNDHVLTAIGEKGFAAGLATRVERLRRGQEELANTRSKLSILDLPPVAVIDRIWPTMSDPERREILSNVLDAVYVTPGRGNTDERVFACPAGTGPARLPRKGGNAAPLRQYRYRRGWIRAQDASPLQRPWSTRRIEHDLRALTPNHTAWPDRNEFFAAGRGRLYAQIQAHGGDEYWAYKLGLPFSNPRRPRYYSSDARIQRTLELYLEGRETFPNMAELHTNGLSNLASAIKQTGGAKRWAYELSVRRAPQTRPDNNLFWTDDRVRMALTGLCQDREVFPTKRVFYEAGLSPLYKSLTGRYTLDRWANEMQLPRPTSRRRSFKSPVG